MNKMFASFNIHINYFPWLGKERDKESGLGDHGVRKYDNISGRFLSIDPQPHAWVWEKYLSWTPYQYAGNNPVNAYDVDGREIIKRVDPDLSEEYKTLGKNDYIKLATSHGHSKNLINDLELNKDFKLELIITDKVSGVKFFPESNTLYYNPKASVPIEGKHYSEDAPGYIQLGHDIGHAWRKMNGVHKGSIKNTNGLKLEEKENIEQNENPIRMQFKDDLEKKGYNTTRTHYNNIPLD